MFSISFPPQTKNNDVIAIQSSCPLSTDFLTSFWMVLMTAPLLENTLKVFLYLDRTSESRPLVSELPNTMVSSILVDVVVDVVVDAEILESGDSLGDNTCGETSTGAGDGICPGFAMSFLNVKLYLRPFSSGLVLLPARSE